MDWTGGTRRRYVEKKNNGIVQTQKAHFARLRNADQPQPLSSMPDFMREAMVAKGYHLPTASQQGRGNILNEARGSSRNSTSAAARPRGRAAAARSSAISPPHGSSHHRGREESDSARATASRGSKRSRDQALTNLTGEERTLHAVRRRLLARSDWLGLNASRPVKIDFPANRDSYRVGKRRKIKKASPRHGLREVQHRRVTPPFQHRERLVQPMLSDAGVEQSINIKIGTDALGSRTQHSRPSNTRANTSMCQPSTGTGPLSEESMLMGEEGDNPGSVPEVPFTIQQDVMLQHSQHIGEQDLMTENEYVPALAEQQWSPTQTTHLMQDAPYMPWAPLMRSIDATLHHDDYADDADRQTHAWNTYFEQYMETAYSSVPMRAPDPQPMMDPLGMLDFVEATASDDEKQWCKAMHIRTRAPSEASIAALKSSSLHHTQSTLSYAPQSLDVLDLPPWLSSPMPTMRADYLESIFRPVSNGHLEETTAPRSGPAPSHTVHATIDNDTAAKPPSVHGTDKDETLWRQYVCGSQGSGSNSSVFEKRLLDEGEEVHPAPRSFFDTTSDQPRSDRVTAGGSTFDVSLTTNSETASSTRDGMDNTSLIGHAATVHQGLDNIEEENSHVPPPKKRFKSYIHASAQLLKKEREQSQPSALPKPSRFLHSTKNSRHDSRHICVRHSQC